MGPSLHPAILARVPAARSCALCIAAILGCLATPAVAGPDATTSEKPSAPSPPPDAPREDATKISLGLAGSYKPEFEGAEENEVLPYPFPLVSVRNFHGLSFEGMALTYDLFDKRGDDGLWEIRTGPSVSLDLGRDEDDSRFLDGLGDVGIGALAGGFVKARYGPVMLNLSGGQDLAEGHGGALLALRLGVMLPLSDDLRIIPGVFATWASEDYMQSYFGISGAQAARSVYAPYDPDAGVKDVGLNLNVTYRIAGNWPAIGLFSYKRLVDEAADSPIVQGPGGSENQFMGMIGLSCGFSF